MKKLISKIVILLTLILAAGAYYYMTIPAINIHAAGFWKFIIMVVIFILVIYCFRKLVKEPKVTRETENDNVYDMHRHKNMNRNIPFEIDDLKHDPGVRILCGIAVIIIAVFIIGSILSSPVVNAKKYQSLMTVKEGDFTKEIEEADFTKIPLLDRDSATLLGNRKMGTLVDMVSQFEVSNLYTQINYKGSPTRVSPLNYASLIKWFTNQSEGIPAYITIDMATQETECVRLEKGNYIKYSQSEYLNRNIYRHLRFSYPTYIFDSLSFEVDEEGVPYWVCPVKKFNIGLFGGQTIGKVVLCNAVTGETSCYDVKDVPQWVDHVFSADLLISLYDYNGTLKHGYFNSILGQKDCLQTTDGYNYIAKDDDVWVYTGITSVSGDQSNVGFVLMNQRTMESRYYSCPGAEEYSAMGSAEGQVQNLGYISTFPLLLNVSGEPTYFMALKDGAGLVKKYAMVNIKKYQNVAIGDTVSGCLESYQSLLKENGISAEAIEDSTKASGMIDVIAPVVLEGNSHYYITLVGDDKIYDVSVSDFPEIITYTQGSRISLEYIVQNKIYMVTKIN